MEKGIKSAILNMPQKKPFIVVVTGAESTGKSVLSKNLAGHFGVPFLSEYAREYVSKLQRPYIFQDLESIAAMQRAQMHAASKMRQPLVIFDTWLIITLVWFEVVYGKAPGWLSGIIASAPIDLFLVCDTDIPWIPDPLRENGGAMRDRLQARYIQLIGDFRFRSCLVSGQGLKRYQTGIDYIESALYKQ